MDKAYGPPLEMMGEGKFGQVYKAKIIVPDGEGEVVCIKRQLIDTDKFREKYEKEVSILMSIKDIPGTVTLIDHYEMEEGGNKYGYIVMECIEGCILSECSGKLDDNGRSVIHKILKILEQIHKRGIVHKDLHQRNIMVKYCRKDTEVTIIDFGEAMKSFKPEDITMDIGMVGNFLMFLPKTASEYTPAYREIKKMMRDPNTTIETLLKHQWFGELISESVSPEPELAFEGGSIKKTRRKKTKRRRKSKKSRKSKKKKTRRKKTRRKK